MERLGYKRQYVREHIDKYTQKPTESYGFKTDGVSRPVIIAELVQHARDHINAICDKNTLLEMLTFVRNEKGRPEAASGAHDDCIMALGIALHAREQMEADAAEDTLSMANWTEDMIEDYERADAEGKAYLRSKWARKSV